MNTIVDFFRNYFNISSGDISVIDLLEIAIIAFLLYEIMQWIRDTRAWVLLKGMIVLLIFILMAALFEMNTILWIAEKTVNVGILALVIIFQPELRKALEQLGQKKVLTDIFPIDSSKKDDDGFSRKVINEIVKSCVEMGKAKTGALIVVQRNLPLTEYIRTGIIVDGVVTSQLLLNIFEHNTPLHDGAVIVSGNRIVAATCYLPLSDNMEISKDLGTRHRAAVGISEASDSITVIVSEETGGISLACEGMLHRNMTGEELRAKLLELSGSNVEQKPRRLKFLKGRQKNERKADK